MLDTEYVCTLKASDLKKAKDELNEDPKQRLGAVQSLREWVQREPWINAPTGKYLGLRQNLSSGFTIERDLNQSPQLQRLA